VKSVTHNIVSSPTENKYANDAEDQLAPTAAKHNTKLSINNIIIIIGSLQSRQVTVKAENLYSLLRRSGLLTVINCTQQLLLEHQLQNRILMAHFPQNRYC
jgi:hypothetical protein